jgi:hypothetical protein
LIWLLLTLTPQISTYALLSQQSIHSLLTIDNNGHGAEEPDEEGQDEEYNEEQDYGDEGEDGGNLNVDDLGQQQDWTEEEYQRELNVLQQKQGVTPQEIEAFKQQSLLKKSLDMVKTKALAMEQTRRGGAHVYGGVRSKVARNIKVKDKVVRKDRRAKVRAQQSDFVEAYATSPEEKIAIVQRKENEKLSVRQLGMTFHQKDTPWQKVHDQKLAETERLLREQEEQIEALQREIEARRELRQSQSPTKFSQLKAASPTFHQQVLESSPPNRHLEDVITNMEGQAEESELGQQEEELNQSASIQLGASISPSTAAQVSAQLQVQAQVQQQVAAAEPVAQQLQPQTMQVRAKKGGVSSGLPQSRPIAVPQAAQQVQQAAPTQQPQVQAQVQVAAQVNVQPPAPQQQQVLPQQQQHQSRNISPPAEKEDTFENLAQQNKIVHRDDKFQNKDLNQKTQAI